jgi:hypothetical protein
MQLLYSESIPAGMLGPSIVNSLRGRITIFPGFEHPDLNGMGCYIFCMIFELFAMFAQ